MKQYLLISFVGYMMLSSVTLAEELMKLDAKTWVKRLSKKGAVTKASSTRLSGVSTGGAVMKGVGTAVVGDKALESIFGVTKKVFGERKAVSFNAAYGDDQRMECNFQFKLGSSELAGDMAKNSAQLQQLVLIMKKMPSYKFMAQGHTCSVGSDMANLDLSVRRADTIRRYLIASGVKASQIHAVGSGEVYPIAGKSPDSPLNRRVEVLIIPVK